jgi:predicted NBD/HSP70 family sugar kinase
MTMRKPKYMTKLDEGFRPCILEAESLKAMSDGPVNTEEIKIAIERNDGCISVFSANIARNGNEEANCMFIERLVKTLLWIRGGHRISIGGPGYIGRYVAAAYMPGGARDFDRRVMERIYEKKFEVILTENGRIGRSAENARPVGRHLEGFRIGFDAGGSDRKVSAVIDGKAVYSEETIWNPKTAGDPSYHFDGILDSMKTAASKMPRVDAIGVSAAGVYINNRVMIASLFMSVPEDRFEKEVKDIFLRIRDEMGGVPLEVANDGDVTALAGSMELNDGNVLGIAMGTSQAGGYVDSRGNITGWLNELAFVPVDLNMDSAIDEWSGDHGCGVKYFSQDAVTRLAEKAGIPLPEGCTPAEKLRYVQDLHEKNDPRTKDIFITIGIYLGYSIAWYSLFYDISHVLILGRVTSGRGGAEIIEYAAKVLADEFPDLYARISLDIPDEKNKRVGQSIAAASLPEL